MTKINIYNNCPFDSTYTHLTHFTSVSQRDSFVNNYISWSATDFKYIQNYVIVPFGRDYIDGCNYIDFTNKNGFRQFAFVDSLECINEVTTKISFTIDYWMTYMFNTDFGSAYVERGHNFLYEKNLLPDYYINANIMLNEFKLYNPGGSNMLFVYIIWLNDELTNNFNQSNIENCSILFTPYIATENGAVPGSYQGLSGISSFFLEKFLSSPRCKGAYVSHYGTISTVTSIKYDDESSINHFWGVPQGNGKIRWDIPKITNNSRWSKLNNYPYCYHKIKNVTGEIILENENLPNMLDISVQQFSGNTQSMVCKCENMLNNGITMYGKSLVDNRQNVLSIVKDDLDNYLFNNANSINNAMRQNTERYDFNTTNNVLSMIGGQQTSYDSKSQTSTNNLILGTARNISSGLMNEINNINQHYNFQATEKAYQLDLKNSPDNIMGMSGNGSSCACYDNLNYFSIQSFGLDSSNLQKMETYFDTYGYPLETVVNVKNTFTCMPYYNYIKTNNLLVHVNNQTAKNIISSTFNRGVWIYHNNANYSNFFNQGGDN